MCQGGEEDMLTLIFVTALALADEPLLVTWQGECNYAGDSYPCEKYTFKGQEYGVMWKDGELHRIDRFLPDGTLHNLYLAPTRIWT